MIPVKIIQKAYYCHCMAEKDKGSGLLVHQGLNLLKFCMYKGSKVCNEFAHAKKMYKLTYYMRF